MTTWMKQVVKRYAWFIAVAILALPLLLVACECGTPTTTTPPPTTTTPPPTTTTPPPTTTTPPPTTTTPPPTTTTSPPTTTTSPPTTTTPIGWHPDMDCGATCHVMASYEESLQDATLLAYAHTQEGLACLDCHELAVLEQIHEEADPDTTELEERKFPMDFCFECHTSYPALIELTEDYTAPAGEKVNPHDTHQGELECYTCHKVHKRSPGFSYCYSCHHQGVLECNTCH